MWWWLLFSVLLLLLYCWRRLETNTECQINMTTTKESTETWSNSLSLSLCVCYYFICIPLNALNVFASRCYEKMVSFWHFVCLCVCFHVLDFFSTAWTVCRNTLFDVFYSILIWYGQYVWHLVSIVRFDVEQYICVFSSGRYHHHFHTIGQWVTCAHGRAIFSNVNRMLPHWDHATTFKWVGVFVCFLSAYGISILSLQIIVNEWPTNQPYGHACVFILDEKQRWNTKMRAFLCLTTTHRGRQCPANFIRLFVDVFVSVGSREKSIDCELFDKPFAKQYQLD